MRKRTYIGYYKGLRIDRGDKRGGRAYFYGIMRSGDGPHIVYTARPRIGGSWWVPTKYAELNRRIESYYNTCDPEEWRELLRALVNSPQFDVFDERGGGLLR